VRTTVNLSVSDPAVVSAKDVAICSGKTYTLPSGLVVSSTGTYNDTLRTLSGCDSLITNLKLTVFSPLSVSKEAQVCSGRSYTLPSGRVVNAAGIYKDTLRNLSGCDSLINTVNLSVLPVLSVNTQASICSGSSYTLPSGTVVRTAGVYKDTLRSMPGCDSLITTATISVFLPSFSNINTILCAGQHYTLPSGRIISQTGLYKDTLHAAGGCDSLLTALDLTIMKGPDYRDNAASICQGSVFVLPSGRIISQTGSYTDTLRSKPGCDSVITRWSLTVASPKLSSNAVSICPGKTFTLPSGTVVSQPGLYADTIKSTLGCDSLITRVTISFIKAPDFGITPPDAMVCAGDSLLLTARGGDVYQWYPTDGLNSPGTASTYVIPTVSADYRVIITSYTCNITDTQSISVMVSPRPVVTVTKSNDVDCMLTSARLNATGGVKYTWLPDGSLIDPNSSSPVAMPRTTTVYHVQVFSAQGCMAEDSIEVVATGGDVSKGYPVPNAFTPNHDGKNDCFGVKPSSWGDVTNFRLSIFNRKGQLLFTATDPAGCWDGTYHGVAQPADTYVYMVSATAICGNVFRKGTLILIR
jgi:gliding motility-associated-like protein